MENDSCTKICRFCLELSDSNFKIIDEVTFANLEFLWLKLNLSISEKPVMCGECAKTIQNYSNFKTKCLEIENYIVSSVKDKNTTKVDLGEVYLSKMSFEDIVNVPEGHIVCRLCLELVKNDSAIFLRNSTDTVLKLEQYFPELDLTCTEDAVICESCQVSLQCYFCFINNCLTTEQKIMEYCKVEGTNDIGQIDLNVVTHFISKGFLKSTFELDAVKIEGTCNEFSEDASYCVETKKEEILDMELDIKEDISVLESELIEKNSFQHQPSPSQSDCELQLTRVKPAKYTCEICGYENNRRDRLEKHMLNNKHRNTIDVLTRGTMHKCDQCDYETRSKFHLTRHALTHQNPSEITMYNCEMCDFKTKRKDCLKVHMLSHKSPSEVTMYKCEMCVYESRRKDHLQLHMLIHMNVHKCEVCPYTTKSKDKLERHLLSHMNTDVVMYKCDLCYYETKRKYDLKSHMLNHKTPSEITMYKCESCAYETKHKRHLRKHKLVHMDTSMYKCGVCNFKTKWKTAYQRHLLCHKAKVVTTTKVVTEDTLCKCDVCDYETKWKSNLKRHMLIHKTPSEVTTFNCEVCEYETKRKFDLKAHMLTHKTSSEVTMYKCEVCDYEAKVKSSLNRHMLTHE